MIATRRQRREDLESIISNYFNFNPDTCQIDEFELFFKTVARWFPVVAREPDGGGNRGQVILSKLADWLAAVWSRLDFSEDDIDQAIPESLHLAMLKAQDNNQMGLLSGSDVSQRLLHALRYVYDLYVQWCTHPLPIVQLLIDSWEDPAGTIAME